MKPFNFRLESVLSLRVSARDACRADLAAAFVARREVSSRREAIESELRAAGDRRRKNLQKGVTSIDSFVQAERYAQTLRSDLDRQTDELRAAEEQVDRCQRVLAESEREVAVLEKLREQQLAEFLQTQSRDACKQLDDVAGQRFQRSRRMEWPNPESTYCRQLAT